MAALPRLIPRAHSLPHPLPRPLPHSSQVNSYIEFKEEMLPRIRKLGYNAIQIMAIQASSLHAACFTLCALIGA